MKCLVTGAGGFVGGFLCRLLADRGDHVVGVDLPLSDGSRPPVVVPCDLLDFGCLAGIVAETRPDQVFHLAGLTSPADSLRRPREYFQANVQGVVNLLEAVRLNSNHARILLVSSAEVYGAGRSGEPIKEDTAPDPSNPYGVSKLLGELAALHFRRCFGSRLVLARPFNHGGPGQRADFVISDFCRQIAELESETGLNAGRPSLKVGNLSSARDFLDVRDVVKAYAGLAEKGLDGEIYNVCSGVGTGIQEVLRIAISLARVPVEIEVSPEKHRPGKGARLVGDNTKLLHLLDWRPEFSLRQTISDTLEFWRKHRND
jgi:GDP-4-dehydro-6-deoxy-D-mannose reductase